MPTKEQEPDGWGYFDWPADSKQLAKPENADYGHGSTSTVVLPNKPYCNQCCALNVKCSFVIKCSITVIIAIVQKITHGVQNQ